MKIGMLWLDNDPKTTTAQKIDTAAAYYLRKHGQQPNLCYVHPTTQLPEQDRVGKVEMRANRSIMPGHFWIGVNGDQATETPAANKA